MNVINSISRRPLLGSLAILGVLASPLATPVAAQDGGDSDLQVNVTDFDTVDIAVQDTDLSAVLQMLAIQSKKNIITSKSVSATVSANLFDVTFYEALDAILRVNGYRYVEEGNFIYIYTAEEYQAIEAAQRQTESRIFELEYLSAVDANEFITPLLSEQGSASYRGDVEQGFQPDVGNGGRDEYAYGAKLVVNDFAAILDRIDEILNDLDTPPQQVLVESTILQTNVDEADSFGVDFSIIGDMNFLDLTSPLSAVRNLQLGGDDTSGFQPGDNVAQAITSSVGNTVDGGGFKMGLVSNDVSIFVKLMDEVTDTTVLARPKVMTLNRQRAEVLVGRRVGYLSTTATETTTTQTVEFLDTGIHLVLRPFISRDGSIRMELAPSVSEAQLRTVTDSGGIAVTIPDEITNEITTNVRLKDGQTLVLGGLFRESTTTTKRQVPFLGEVPILGNAFKGHDDMVVRTEIIFLITPSIVQDQTLWEMGEDSLELAEAIQVGARAGLLPFSRTRITAGYNQQAVDAANAGDTDLALYYVNNSLRINPNQAVMIEMRENLTGEESRTHEGSMLEQIVRNKLGPQMSFNGSFNGNGATALSDGSSPTFRVNRTSPNSTTPAVPSNTFLTFVDDFDAPESFDSASTPEMNSSDWSEIPASTDSTWESTPTTTSNTSNAHEDNSSASTSSVNNSFLTTVDLDESVAPESHTGSTVTPAVEAASSTASASWNSTPNVKSNSNAAQSTIAAGQNWRIRNSTGVENPSRSSFEPVTNTNASSNAVPGVNNSFLTTIDGSTSTPEFVETSPAGNVDHSFLTTVDIADDQIVDSTFTTSATSNASNPVSSFEPAGSNASMEGVNPAFLTMVDTDAAVAPAVQATNAEGVNTAFLTTITDTTTSTDWNWQSSADANSEAPMSSLLFDDLFLEDLFSNLELDEENADDDEAVANVSDNENQR